MKLIKGDILQSPADVICFTSNGVMGPKGLVMGAGSALAFRVAFPGLELAFFGTMQHTVLEYGFRVVEFQSRLIGAFQTKTHWMQDSTAELVEKSCLALTQWLADHEGQTVAIPYPAIGYGKLSKAVVEPLLRVLSDDVWVYERS